MDTVTAGKSAMAVVRYLVDDVEEVIAFYTDHLGFTLEGKSRHAPVNE
jgi:catechol 2,3-dioxygenase-like lactoylglutathione lyase family enzyme